ncbi:hypothetical protein SZ64_00705 [Erythrobacter sp. SG61-1L]|uniref:polymorphic toxin-type HINT domain-containing protein n=1 Tax=Erythrobacter sp. SG61-1L TaxID=1603897 RepID=UPI0006C91498|nr:polymorphic toxin-type HINT domain-containing protein [Erythrobacter sp. SG61-1L]KPL66749.1 hypothetical protein SZ64_00705 [Erythrobacter sp. SG61-1L]
MGSALLGRGSDSVSLNAATGNLLISHQDEFLIGLGPDAAISRTYNSIQDAADGDNGDHWQQNTARKVFGLTGTLNTVDSTISRLGADGSVIVYGWDTGRSAYLTKDGSGAFDTLTNSGSEWVWTDGDSQVKEYYEVAQTAGEYRIRTVADIDGNALTFTYITGSDHLDKATTADGSWTQYGWSGNSITQVVTGYTDLATSSAKTLTRVRYGYDGQGRLETVTTDLTPGDNSVGDGNSYVTTYTYDGATNRIASISQADGSHLAVTYDGLGRVLTLTQAVAAGVTRVTTLTYGVGYTEVAGPDGQVTRLDYDVQNRLTQITAPPAASGAAVQTVQFAYDADGNLETVTDSNGKITSYTYDANGNNTRVTDPTGNALARTYDGKNRLITEQSIGSDERGKAFAHYTQYAYDSEGHLRFTVDAAARVTEYRYTTAGQLSRTISYVGHSRVAGETEISVAEMEAWVPSLTDLNSVRIAENTYDARGNLVLSKAYGIADNSGNPLTSEGVTTAHYAYDQAGNLLEGWREGEAHETFLYDGMGRLYSSTDRNGGTTTVTFIGGGSTTIVTTAAGLTTTSVYNKAGELISLTESGAGTTAGTATYEYDAAGRLRSVTDASGRSSYIYYDKGGRKVASANEYGEVTEFRYDTAGRLAATISYATALSAANKTAFQNPASTADFADIRPSTSAADVWSWTVYDDAGRVIQSIDNAGGTVTNEYDKAGQLVKSVAWYTALSGSALAALKVGLPTAPVLPTAHAKDVVARSFYNAAGQHVGVLDGEGYLSETIYDAAGVAIETIAYATATKAADRASGTFEALRAYVAGSSTVDRFGYAVYDGQGLLRFDINAQGGVVGYGYDAAGRLVSTTVYTTELDLGALADRTYASVKAAVTSNAVDRTSHTVYDSAGRVAYTVDAKGGVAAFSYDTSGRVTKAVAFDNLYSSSVTLSALNNWAANSAQANDTANRITRNWYNSRDEVVFSLDSGNFVTGYAYDQEGRAVSTTRYGGNGMPVGDSTTISQLASLLAGTPTTTAITVSQSYDEAGNVLSTTDGEGFVTRNAYNALGQLTDVYTAYGTADQVRTHYEYDGVGRLKRQFSAYGEAEQISVQFAYDGLGNQSSVTDANGNVTSFTYDKLGRVLTATNALIGTTRYVYDTFGNVVKATDALGNATYNYYDSLNRLVATRDARGFVTTTRYNRFNEVVESARFSVAVTGSAETGVAVFDPAQMPGTSGSLYSLYNQLQAAAHALNAPAIAAEGVAAQAQADADAAQAYADNLPTAADVQTAYNAATQAQAAADATQAAAVQAAADAAAAAAAVLPFQAAAGASQAEADALQSIADGVAADAAQAQADAVAAQAAADAAWDYLESLQGPDQAEVQAAYDAAAALQVTADGLQATADQSAADAASAQAAAVTAQSAANAAAATAAQKLTAYNNAVTAAASAQTAYNTASQEAADALAAANAATTAYNTAAAAVTSQQTTVNNLASQLSSNTVAQAYASPITSLQAYSNSLQTTSNNLQTQISAATASMASLSPEYQYLYYIQYVQPLQQQQQAVNTTRTAVNNEITSVQAGSQLSAAGKTYVNTYKGFTTQQVSDYQALQSNYDTAVATLATRQSQKASAQTAMNSAVTLSNQKASAKTAALNTKNTADAAVVTANNARQAANTAATQAQNAANAAQTTANEAASAAASAQATADAAQDAADQALDYADLLASGGNPDVQAAYEAATLAQQSAAALDAQADAGEAAQAQAQAIANAAAAAAAGAEALVDDLEGQIANYSGGGAVSFEAERAAALANASSWINSHENWLDNAEEEVSDLDNGTSGLVLAELTNYCSLYSAQTNYVEDLGGSYRSLYINVYYNNLTWRANNVGADRAVALADKLSWLVAREQDLENWITGFAGVSGGGVNPTQTMNKLKLLWVQVRAAIYDLNHNTYSTGWPSSTSTVNSFYSSGKDNASFVPSGISGSSSQTSTYRAGVVINAYFDVANGVGEPLGGSDPAYSALLADLAQAQSAASSAHDADTAAQVALAAATSTATQLRTASDLAQLDADAAIAYADQLAAQQNNSQEIQAAQDAYDAALEAADAALAAANQAVADAVSAQVSAHEGQASADADLVLALAAQAAADEAASDAVQAQSDADAAQGVANAALANAQQIEASIADPAAAQVAHDAAVQARAEADAAQAIADQLRNDANVAQAEADAAYAAAQAGSGAGILDNFELFNLPQLGARSAVYYSYDKLGHVTQRIDAEGYVETSAYNAFGQMVSFSRYELSIYGSRGGQSGKIQEAAANVASLQQIADSRAAQADALAAEAAADHAAHTALANNAQGLRADANAKLSTANSLQQQANTTATNLAPQITAAFNAYFVELAAKLPSMQQTAQNAQQEMENWYYSLTPEQLANPSVGAMAQYYQSQVDQAWANYSAANTVVNNQANYSPGDALPIFGTSAGATYTSLLQQVASARTAASNAMAAYVTADGLADSAEAAASAAQVTANQSQAAANSAQSQANTAQNAASAALLNLQQLKAAQQNGTAQLPSFTLGQLDDPATTSFEYDLRGQLVRSTDAEGFAERYTYDAFGRRVSTVARSYTTNPATAGGTTTYTYDKRGLLLSETDPSGSGRTEYQYDGLGNVRRKIEAAGFTEARATNYVYDKLGRLTQTTGDTRTVLDQNGHVAFDANFVPTEAVTYDANGNVTKTVDAAGNRTVFFYDKLNRKTHEINAIGAHTVYTYDANGNVKTVSVYEGNGSQPATGGADNLAPGLVGAVRQTSFEYDALGKMTESKVLLPSGYKTGVWNGSSWTNTTTTELVTQYEYDYLGNVVKLTDPENNKTFSYYDALGRKTSQVDGEGYLTAWSYNSDGNVLSERRFAARFTGAPNTSSAPVIAFDANDRVTEYTYDENGNRLSERRLKVTIFDGQGASISADATVHYQYNGLGQVTRKTEATGDAINYFYDAAGRLWKEQRPQFTDYQGSLASPQVNYEYDALGNLTRTTQAGLGGTAARITQYTYGAGGLLDTVTDAEGNVHQYFYDDLGHVIRDQYFRAGSAGGQGTLEAVLSKYDALGRVTEQKVAAWISSAWQAGDVSSTEYNTFGDVVRSGINGAWQQQNMYDAAGRLWASNSGDGIWKYFGYDKNGSQTVAITSAGADLSGKTFSQARALISEANVNATYTVYDGRNLATSVVEEERQLIGSAGVKLTTTRNYNAFGEVASETNAAGAKLSYTYNTMGRMIRSESPAVEITLESGATKWVKPAEDYYYDVSGRLVAMRDANGNYAAGGADAATGTSKDANKGNLTRLTLLAGTGYDGSQALVTEEIYADGGRKRTGYDIHGDARVAKVLFDGTGSSSNDIWLETEQTFDKLGRLIERRELRQKYSTGTQNLYTADDFYESYRYDLLGQQIKHGNSHYNAYDAGAGGYLGSNIETTDYDLQGRVVSTRAFGGDVTTYTYSWDATIAAGGIGYTAPGGWSKVTTYANSKMLTERADLFGRATYKSDLGGHITSYTYDLAGRLTKSQIGSTSYNYEYYNTGQISKAFTVASGWTYYTSTVGNGGIAAKQTLSGTTTQSAIYTYDEVGNRRTEYGTLESGSTTVVWKDHTATYDALGRLTSDTIEPTTVQPEAKVEFGYDANGNVMMKRSTYRYMNAEGGFNTSDAVRTSWYRYDNMNRVVINNGDLYNGVISLATPINKDFVGDPSQSLTYNKAGQRISVTTNQFYEYYLQPMDLPPYGSFSGSLTQYTATETERYVYDGAGRLNKIYVAGNTFNQQAYIGAALDAATGGPPMPSDQAFVVYTAEVLRGTFAYDKLNRQTAQNTYDTDGTTVVYNTTTTYNTQNGRVDATFASTLKSDGKTYTQSVTNNYGAGTSYALGTVISFISTNNVTGQSAKTSTTTNTFEWWDGAVQKTIHYVEGSNDWTTTFNYNGLGQLINAHIADDQVRDVYFTLDEVGQIIRRDETKPSNAPSAQTGSPHELWYRLGDREIGYVGNNGGTNPTLLTSLSQQQTVGDTGTFRSGSTKAQSSIGFAQALDPINLHEQGSLGGSWTVKAGDTLQSIAQKLYGDASLWYKIAETNGLSVASNLIAGQQLTLPSGVLRNTYTADSFRPYDPAQAIGDLSPSTPKPPKKNNCGLFGQILLAAIAIGISVIAPFGGSFLASIGNSMLGSVVSQTVGFATGIQDSFSWKSVALAGVSSVVGAGVADVFGQGAVAGSQFLGDVVRGAVSSAVTQGIGVATHLQDKFSWAGVAAAGMAAGVGGAVQRGLNSKNGSFGKDGSWSWDKDFQPGQISQAVAGGASLIASAATRSAIEGTSFGDNLIAGLPDVIGQVLARAVVAAAKGNGTSEVPAIEIANVNYDPARGPCFVAGTLVATASGALPIEDLRVGDLVYSRNDRDVNGAVSERKIIERYRFENKDVIEIVFQGEKGAEETIIATKEHPFYVVGSGWVATGDLTIGIEVINQFGRKYRISSLNALPDKADVYNFAVEIDHTYFVGNSRIWVHNEYLTVGNAVINTVKAETNGKRERIDGPEAPKELLEAMGADEARFVKEGDLYGYELYKDGKAFRAIDVALMGNAAQSYLSEQLNGLDTFSATNRFVDWSREISANLTDSGISTNGLSGGAAALVFAHSLTEYDGSGDSSFLGALKSAWSGFVDWLSGPSALFNELPRASTIVTSVAPMQISGTGAEASLAIAMAASQDVSPWLRDEATLMRPATRADDLEFGLNLLGVLGLIAPEFRAASPVARIGSIDLRVAGAAERGVWRLNPFARGQQIEQALGHNLPGNFPVIDKFENGLATSIKSVDLDAVTYQSGSTLTRTLNGYVDTVAEFQGRTWAGVRIRPQDISGRALDLAIPHSGSSAQQAIINQTVEYGASRGVSVNVILFP